MGRFPTDPRSVVAGLSTRLSQLSGDIISPLFLFMTMDKEEIRKKLSLILIDTDENNPIKCNILIGEEQGLSSLELLEIESMFQQPSEGIIWFNIKYAEEPLEFDDLKEEDLNKIMEYYDEDKI